MSRPLTGACALITGSLSGIGLAAARRFAAAGCHVVLHGLGDAGSADTLRHGIQEDYGVRTIYSGADLREPAQIGRMFEEARTAFGRVDILVNNAVVRHTAPIEHFPAEAWDEAIAVNLSAAFHAIRLSLPAMKASGWGRIINLSSIYGLRGTADRVGYVTTKTALIGLTRAVAVETVAHGITCNAICPGTADTPLHQSRVDAMVAEEGVPHDEAVRRVLAGKQPGGRLIPAANVAALMLFLCSPEASEITGAVLPVDGGWGSS